MKVELTKKCSGKTHAFIQTEIWTKKHEEYFIFSHNQTSTKIRKIYWYRLFGYKMNN
jgi:hypothetical protein